MEKITSVEDFMVWWQYETGGSIRSLARALDVTPGTIYKWRDGSNPVTERYWKIIEQVSGGRFKPQELYSYEEEI